MISTILSSLKTQEGFCSVRADLSRQDGMNIKLNTMNGIKRFITFANIMIAENIHRIKQISGQNTRLVVVSKNRTPEEILQAYQAGIRDFAENKVQTLLAKKQDLPSDIRWHLIGHLQTNKVKDIASFIHCIQSVDSIKLAEKINAEASKQNRIIDCLLQVFIAKEESKFGLEKSECLELLQFIANGGLKNIHVTGLMGMASNTDDLNQVQSEFSGLKYFYDSVKDEFDLHVLSMGMSSDFQLAVECGSNMVRIGSAIFA